MHTHTHHTDKHVPGRKRLTRGKKRKEVERREEAIKTLKIHNERHCLREFKCYFQ